MSMRIFLDGTLINDEPLGWDTFVTTLKRDRTLKGILLTADGTFTFGGDGYTYLRNIFDTTGFCGVVNLEVQRSCDDGNTFSKLYQGVIFISSIEFDEKRCLARAKIEDNSFYAKINNNKSQECLPHAGRSKNGGTITATPVYQIKYFNPIDGTYYSIPAGTRSCAGYKIYDVFKYLVEFMTDDEVAFDSVTFGVGGDWEGLMMTYGLVISTATAGMDTNTFESNFPRISFQKVFIEIDRLINIGFYVDYSGSKPTLFIEADSLMHKTNSILTTADIDELKTSTDSELLFSKLSIGGNKWDENPNLSFPSSIEWLGYRSEQYNIIGNCNIDTEIDLTRDFVVDTNAIQDAVDVVNFGSEANDDDIFILHTYFDSGIIWKCEQSNFLTAGPPYYYNQYFTNNQIAGRYLGAVPNSVAFWLGAPLDATFQASSTAVYTDQVLINPSTTEPIPFQDDSNAPNFDANGNYNNATYYYTIPANGQYTFYVKLFLQLVQLSATTGVNVFIEVKKYAAGPGALLDSFTIANYNVSLLNFILENSVLINADAGQMISVQMTVTRQVGEQINLLIKEGSIFGCIKDVTGGGIYQSYNPEDYSALLHKYSYPFSTTDYDAILNDIRAMITFNRTGQNTRVGWIDQIKFKHAERMMEVILTSNKAINNGS